MVTTPDKYSLPNMQDLSNGLHGCTIFSKIDLVQGYHQILVATTEIPKTAIITPFGLFEYLLTPFGLSNAAQTFQRIMDLTTDGVITESGCFLLVESVLLLAESSMSTVPHPEAISVIVAATSL